MSDDLKKLYGKEYFDKHRRNAGYGPSLKMFLTEVIKYDPKNVLDVGCGHGHLVKMLLDRGIDTIGLDFSEYAGELIPKDKFILADARRLPFEDKSFDVVCSKGVLEHIPEGELDEYYNEMERVGKNIVIEICPKDKPADGHITIHPQEWWSEKYPRAYFVSRNHKRKRHGQYI